MKLRKTGHNAFMLLFMLNLGVVILGCWVIWGGLHNIDNARNLYYVNRDMRCLALNLSYQEMNMMGQLATENVVYDSGFGMIAYGSVCIVYSTLMLGYIIGRMKVEL